MNKKFLIIGIMLLVSSNVIFGQFAEWTNYTNPEYLTDYVETNNKVWFSSKGGVFEVNKSNLQVTEHNRSNSDISSDAVEGIAVDGNGFIWIGTYEQLIAKFDGTTWESIPFPDSLFDAPYGFVTNCIEVDNQNRVWVGTSEGLAIYDGTNWQAYNSDNGFVDMDNILALNMDSQGNMYIASNFIFKYNGNAFQKISNQAFSVYGRALFSEQSNGDMWFSNISGNLAKYDGTYWTEYTTQNGLPQEEILTLGETSNGEMYLTTQNEGKYTLQNGTWVKNLDLINTEINTNEITTYFYDNQGNKWIGSQDKLLIDDGQNTTVKTLRTHTINSNTVRDVSVDANGKVYIVNESDIAVFDGTTWSNYPSPTNTILSKTLFINDNKAFVSSFGGINVWDGTNWTFYTTSNSTLPTATINKWKYDENTDILWLATTQGLVEFDGTNFTTYDPSNTIMTNDYIYSFDFDNNGLIYVAGAGELMTFDGTTWQDISANLPVSPSIREIHFDNTNTLWAGTNEGLYKLENGNWVVFDETNSNLPNKFVRQIISDENGQLFIATLNGLAVLENGIIEGFTIENSGISSNLLKGLVFDKNDNLWITTNYGVTVYDLNTTNTRTILTKNSSLKVFPNPIRTTAMVSFDLNQATDNIRVKIISVDGRTIQERLIEGRTNYGTQQLEINRNQIANGLYYLSVQTDSEQLVQPILIQD